MDPKIWTDNDGEHQASHEVTARPGQVPGQARGRCQLQSPRLAGQPSIHKKQTRAIQRPGYRSDNGAGRSPYQTHLSKQQGACSATHNAGLR